MADVSSLKAWLISEGRVLGDEERIVQYYCDTLAALGVPLARARIAQSYLNPLLSAWGIIWTNDGIQRYTVSADVLATSAWHGSPFEHVVTTRTPIRKRLREIDLAEDHILYSELAEAGATDFLAMPLEYGDGSVQGCSFTTDNVDGFSDAAVALIEDTRHALAAALEPIAMRESQSSLLRTYLGHRPADEVGHGLIKRGEHRTVSAAILFADLRGFTQQSQTLSENMLLAMMGDYFEMLVTPIHENGGDVLKFMGDGILAIFDTGNDTGAASRAAVSAATKALAALNSYNEASRSRGHPEIEFVVGIDHGAVTFGNIGSPDRLDFTVVGPAVNIASRVQDLCKTLETPLLTTAVVAAHLNGELVSAGFHAIRGLEEKLEVFAVSEGA